MWPWSSVKISLKLQLIDYVCKLCVIIIYKVICYIFLCSRNERDPFWIGLYINVTCRNRNPDCWKKGWFWLSTGEALEANSPNWCDRCDRRYGIEPSGGANEKCVRQIGSGYWLDAECNTHYHMYGYICERG